MVNAICLVEGIPLKKEKTTFNVWSPALHISSGSTERLCHLGKSQSHQHWLQCQSIFIPVYHNDNIDTWKHILGIYSIGEFQCWRCWTSATNSSVVYSIIIYLGFVSMAFGFLYQGRLVVSFIYTCVYRGHRGGKIILFVLKTWIAVIC